MTRFAIPYTMRRRHQALREDYSTVLLYSIGIPGKIKGKGGGGGGGVQRWPTALVDFHRGV